jgi:hypothetical protein
MATLPLITGEWVELRVNIDIASDIQRVYYDGDLLIETSWTEGMGVGGAPNIACVDLYSSQSSSIYFDDLSLVEGVTSIGGSTWSSVKQLFK